MLPPMPKQKGFTLLELVIVSAAICSIAAIAIPSYRQALRAAHEAAAVSNLRALAAAETAAIGTGQSTPYVPLSRLGPGGENLIDEQLAAGLKQGYGFAIDPVWGNDGAATGYVLRATPCAAGYRTFTLASTGVLASDYFASVCHVPLQGAAAPRSTKQ